MTTSAIARLNAQKAWADRVNARWKAIDVREIIDGFVPCDTVSPEGASPVEGRYQMCYADHDAPKVQIGRIFISPYSAGWFVIHLHNGSRVPVSTNVADVAEYRGLSLVVGKGTSPQEALEQAMIKVVGDAQKPANPDLPSSGARLAAFLRYTLISMENDVLTASAHHGSDAEVSRPRL